MRYVLIPLDMCIDRSARILSRVAKTSLDGSCVSGEKPERIAEVMLHALGFKVVSELRGDLDEFEEG